MSNISRRHLRAGDTTHNFLFLIFKIYFILSERLSYGERSWMHWLTPQMGPTTTAELFPPTTYVGMTILSLIWQKPSWFSGEDNRGVWNQQWVEIRHSPKEKMKWMCAFQRLGATDLPSAQLTTCYQRTVYVTLKNSPIRLCLAKEETPMYAEI